MLSGTLSGLIIALAGGLFGSTSVHLGEATLKSSSSDRAALYSVVAQATTTATVPTGTTVTVTVAATGIVTGSSTITTTATASITGATTSITPAPLPTPPSQANLQVNPFDWGFLTSAPGDPKIGPFAWVFLLLMLGLIGAGAYFMAVKRPQWKASNPILYRAVNRFAPYALWVGGIGILFLLFRLVSLDLFNLRIWLYLTLLAAVALGAWIFYWYRTSYPKEMAKYQKTQKARQYMPSAKAGARSNAPVAAPNRPASAGGTPNPSRQGNKNRKKR